MSHKAVEALLFPALVSQEKQEVLVRWQDLVERKDEVKVNRALFDRRAWGNLAVNLAKCEFAMGTVRYLSKVVGQRTVQPV